MEPTPTPSAAPPAIGEPIIELIRTQRQNAGAALALLGALLFAGGAFLAYKAFRPTPAPEPDKPLTDDKAFDPSKPPELKTPGEIENLRRTDYHTGWVACIAAFAVAVGGAVRLMAFPPKPDAAEQRTEARILILAVGHGLGAILILAGIRFFYAWSDSLTKWLDTSETVHLRWVLIPLMMIVAGAGLVFFSIQPARAEERNNAGVRRIVYGANFALTVLLTIVALVVVNVVIAVKVPNRLDVTETGFYSLSDATKRLLEGLKEPINVYAILPDDTARETADIRQLLRLMEEAGRGKFKLKFYSEIANREDLRTFRAKYPALDLALSQRTASGAVLLTAGEGEKRNAVIPDNEFTTTKDRKPVFQGESRMFKELVVLADTDTKPVVYFTQSNGEMSIDPAAEAPDDRKATRLRSYLEKNYLDVRPLNFPLENPTVPADAAVVVVAEPRVPFSPAAAGAIKKYMTDPAKKGRLVVLAGIVPGPNNRGVMKTGLEEVLRELNVLLGERFVYTFPIERNSHPLQTLAGFTATAIRSRHEVALAIAKAVNTISMLLPREVAPMTANPTFQATVLLGSVGVTWVEEDRIPEAKLGDVIEDLSGNAGLQASKGLTKGGRPLAVMVSQGGTPTAAVFGNAHMVSDEVGMRGSPDSAPITFDLVGVTIDWLRGRPSGIEADIAAKQYAEYQFPQPATVDSTRLEYLPLGLAVLTVVGLGAGVWVVRRR